MFLIEIALGLGAIYWAPMQRLFETAWLTPRSLGEPVVALVGICIIDEIRKLFARRREGDSKGA